MSLEIQKIFQGTTRALVEFGLVAKENGLNIHTDFKELIIKLNDGVTKWHWPSEEKLLSIDTSVKSGGQFIGVDGSSFVLLTGNTNSQAVFQEIDTILNAIVLGGVPSGADTQFQYNNGGVFGGVSSLTFDDITGNVLITGTNNLNLNSNSLVLGGQLRHTGTNMVIANKVPAGALFFQTNTLNAVVIDSGGAVINNFSANGTADFSVLKQTAGTAFIVDVSTGNVGIGLSLPSSTVRLHIQDTLDNGGTSVLINNNFSLAGSIDETVELRFAHTGSTSAIIISGKDEDFIGTANRSGNLQFWTRLNSVSIEQIHISSEGATTFNYSANGTADFEVKKQTSGTAFFVDVSTGFVGIETIIPTGLLTIHDNAVAGASMLDIFADDENPWCLRIANKIYSTNINLGFKIYVTDIGTIRFNNVSNTFLEVNDSGILKTRLTTSFAGVNTSAILLTDRQRITLGTSSDFYMFCDTAVFTINSAVGSTLQFSNTSFLVSRDVIIGIGAIGVDYKLTFDGESNNGIITFMEDEKEFRFDSDLVSNGDLLTGSEYGWTVASEINLGDGLTQINADATRDNISNKSFIILDPASALTTYYGFSGLVEKREYTVINIDTVFSATILEPTGTTPFYSMSPSDVIKFIYYNAKMYLVI